MKPINRSQSAMSLKLTIKICFILGVGSGVVLIPFMAMTYYSELNFIEIILLPILVPIMNGLVVTLYGVGGYWLYQYLAKKGKI